MSQAHAQLPLPALAKQNRPTNLPQLVHFLHNGYAQVDHPDKFRSWLKPALKSILPVTESSVVITENETATTQAVQEVEMAGPAGSQTVEIDVASAEEQASQPQAQTSSQPQSQPQTHTQSQPQPQAMTSSANESKILEAHIIQEALATLLSTSAPQALQAEPQTTGVDAPVSNVETVPTPPVASSSSGGPSNTVPITPFWVSGKSALVAHLIARCFNNPMSKASHPISLLDLVSKLVRNEHTLVGEGESARHRWALGQGELIDSDEAVAALARGLLKMAAVHNKCYDRILPILYELLNITSRLSPQSLNGVHAAYAEAALYTRDYRNAEPILAREISDVSFYKLDPLDFVKYHHYGGIIYTEMGYWKQAREMLEMAVTAPADTFSPLHIDSHKVLTLVNLIIDGEPFTYPKYISPNVFKAIREHCKLYDDYADAFRSRNSAKVWAINGADFKKDCNQRLLEATLDAYIQRQIMQLTKVYSRMSLEDVAARIEARGGKGKISVDEVYNLLSDLITQRKLFARIVTDETVFATPFVVFEHDASLGNDRSNIQNLSYRIRQSQSATVMTSGRDKKLGLHENWLKKVIKYDEPSARSGVIAGGDIDGEMLFGGGPPTGMGATVKGAGADWEDAGF